MRNIKVSKDRLVVAIANNRTKPNEEYSLMMSEYKKNLLDATRKMLAENDTKTSGFQTKINLTEPVNHDQEYGRVRSMLEMSVEDEITLSNDEYRQYVMDEWVWASGFELSKSMYLNNII